MSDRCPHCGADGNSWWRLPDEYIHVEQVELTEITLENALRALELEVIAHAHYREMEAMAETTEAETYFRRISRHEETHIHELERMMGVEAPYDPEFVTVPEDDGEKFQLIVKLEKDAIEQYSQAIEEATEDRAIDVFTAFFDVEQEHQNLAEVQTALH